jgi:ectoine hydroxylase-related dioxygenase (phytanoyl-CoA dioxygenase family)
MLETLVGFEEALSPPEWIITNRVNGRSTYGLLRVETVLPAEHRLDDASIVVRFAGVEQSFPATSLILENRAGERRCRVHLLTHLTENGRHRFSAEIIWESGMRAPLGEIVIDVDNVGVLAASVRDDLRQFHTPPIIGRYVDSRHFPGRLGKARPWFDDPEAVAEVPLSLEPQRTAEAARMHLIRWGFAVLDYRIDANLVNAFRAEYEAAIDNGRLPYTRGTSERIRQAHELPHGRKIWLDPVILNFLREWFRDEPCACQTLLYINGSQQDAHQDTIHLTPYPSGYMCGVWIALQDVVPESGELFVCPGSHRSHRFMSADLRLPKVDEDYSSYAALTKKIEETLKTESYQQVAYRPRLGEVLVWHENLIHGGLPRVHSDRERHSIVSHYFARGCVAYYDSRGEAANLEELNVEELG